MSVEGLRLEAYFGEGLRSHGRDAGDVLMELFSDHRVTVGVLFRGLEGFGANRRLQVASFPDISGDLPLVAAGIGSREQIAGLVADVRGLIGQGLVTLQPLRLLEGEDIGSTALPSGAGPWLKLAIFCGRGDRVGPVPAYRAIVEQLWRQGAGGATVLLGVDGHFRGARRRTELFGRNASAPLMIVTVLGEREARRALPALRELAAGCVVSVEPVTVLKHDGRGVTPLPDHPADRGLSERWSSIEVYSRRSDLTGRRAVHGELVRQLRRLGAAGCTTVVGEWGLSSEGPPSGDKLWPWQAHVPTVTRYVDRAADVTRLWPAIDEITSRFGLVTWQPVGACEERAGQHAAGSLERPVGPAFPPLPPGRRPVTGSSGHPGPTSAEARWSAALKAEVIDYARRCGREDIAVRVTLGDGEQFFLRAVDQSPGCGYVTLHPHPRAAAELIVGADGRQEAPREVIVALRSIAKLELLAGVPRGTRSLAVFETGNGDGSRPA